MNRQVLLPLANGAGSVLSPTRLHRVRERLYRAAGVALSKGATVNGHCQFLGPNVVLGSSWIGLGCWLISTPTASVVIGDRCDIGPGVMITAGTHEIGSATRRAGKDLGRSVVVGDGTWIGARALVLAGVTIGPGSVVAAGAVVACDIPANSVAAGVPARVIRTLE